jgi:hypothetical protein
MVLAANLCIDDDDDSTYTRTGLYGFNGMDDRHTKPVYFGRS